MLKVKKIYANWEYGMKNYHVAVVGATGAVGNEMIRILEERRFPVGKLTLLASERSVGKELSRSMRRKRL
jgi:aspartate-semialdehyde dehydrogenase